MTTATYTKLDEIFGSVQYAYGLLATANALGGGATSNLVAGVVDELNHALKLLAEMKENQ